MSSEHPAPANAPPAILVQAIATLRSLLDEAAASGDPEPTAMNLATCDDGGRVSSRIVLLKALDERGLQFFTNYESAKGHQLAGHPQAALSLHWKTLRDQVQVRVEGLVERIPAAQSDAYFATRPRQSQIGAWASLQSQSLPERGVFDTRVVEFEQRYAGVTVPRPPHWGGYLLVPDLIEFWYGARYRMHERVRHLRRDGIWASELLYP